jgi:hypothetical protein
MTPDPHPAGPTLEGNEPPIHVQPVSLRRRAPTRLEMIDESTQAPAILGRAGVHLSAGCRYRVHLQTCPTDSFGHLEGVSLDGGEFLRVVVPASGGKGEYVAVLFSRGKLSWPFPILSRFTVDLRHHRSELFSLNVPVIIWPSRISQLSWVLTLISTFILARFRQTNAPKDRHILDILADLVGDRTIQLEIAYLFCGLLILLWLAGWVWVAFGSMWMRD